MMDQPQRGFLVLVLNVIGEKQWQHPVNSSSFANLISLVSTTNPLAYTFLLLAFVFNLPLKSLTMVFGTNGLTCSLVIGGLLRMGTDGGGRNVEVLLF